METIVGPKAPSVSGQENSEMKAIHRSFDDKQLLAKRRLIYEMMEASMALSKKKGRHELEKGCGCISCVNKRRQFLNGPLKRWKFVL